MPRISNTVSPELFEAMRERAEAIRQDQPDIDLTPIASQPQWPDDAILPDKKEAEIIETSQADEVDGDLVAGSVFGDIANTAISKVSQLEGLKLPEQDSETVAESGGGSAIGNVFRDISHSFGNIRDHLQPAIDAIEDDAGVVETQADDVYEADAAPVEASDDGDPYDTDS